MDMPGKSATLTGCMRQQQLIFRHGGRIICVLPGLFSAQERRRVWINPPS
jgi:hypothetical protein